MAGFRAFAGNHSPADGSSFNLDEAESRHLSRVLRAQIGAPVTLFNATGSAWSTELTAISQRQCELRIIERISAIPAIDTNLLVASLKPKAMDELVRRASALGIHTISPVITSRSEASASMVAWNKRIERTQTIAIESCKQSGNLFLPKLMPIQTLNAWLESQAPASRQRLVACLDNGSIPVAKAFENPKTAPECVAIGPEGDFTPDEYKSLLRNGFTPVSLGPTVLRSEDAAFYLLAVIRSLASISEVH